MSQTTVPPPLPPGPASAPAATNVVSELPVLRRVPFAAVLTGLVGLLVVSVTAGVMIGPVSIQPTLVWRIVGVNSLNLPMAETWSASQESIVWLVRMPRVLLGAVVGAGLAVVGVAFQALVRNALAEPYLLGVSNGASVGASAVILLGAFSAFGMWALAAGAFLGALAAVVAVFAIAQRAGRVTPLRLILSGVAMGGVFSAVTSFLIMTAEDGEAARSVLFWMLGSLTGASWAHLGIPLVAVALGVAWLIAQSRSLNAMVIGDDTAATLGVDVARFRRKVILVASVVTGTVVAVSGAIGFVGLMVPHMIRLVMGADHRRLLPVAALFSASFLIWVDIGARMVLAPTEVPIGILTSLIGAPFFVFLMRSSRHGFKEASS